MGIDSATDDTIRVSLTVAIRFTDASVNRYTPNYYISFVFSLNVFFFFKFNQQVCSNLTKNIKS